MVIMRTSIAVLLVTVTAFIIYDWVTFREAMVQNLLTQARTIAGNSTAALAFRNEDDATNVLYSLRSEPHVVAAAIYDSQGKLFVKYPTSLEDTALPSTPQGRVFYFTSNGLTVSQPIAQAGPQPGMLYLRSDLTGLWQRLEIYGAISLLIMGGSLLLALWLSATLQSRISNPIIALAGTAREITGKRNFSVRAAKTTDDELGDLVEAFNTMLDQIQASHSELEVAAEALRVSGHSERERAEELAIMIEAMPTPVILVHDKDARHMTGNRAAANLVKIHPGGEISMTAPDGIKPRHFKTFKNGRELPTDELPAQRAARGERVDDFEFDLVFEDGSVRNLIGYGTPLLDAEGRPRGAVHTLVDITALKRAEAKLREAKELAESANRSKDDFLAALSHELRTPLNPVLLVASDAANNAQLPPQIRSDFEMIRRNVELEARLIDDLLDLTRISRGKLSLDSRVVDVHPILREAIAIVRPEAESKGIKLNPNLRADQPFILGDAVRLQQIFWNILKNAVKFTPVGGEINVETSVAIERGTIIAKVTDTGIGLTRDEINRIFNVFTQGDHAHAGGSHRFGGLGLGLAISRSLIELHSGVIDAQSPGRGQGATFTVEIPRVQMKTIPIEPPNLENARPTSGKNGGLRILLVEDHDATRMTLQQLLVRRNYRVMLAASLAEARTIARQQTFDLVISDIGLPDGSGNTLMTELKDAFGLKGIALTGYGMDHDISAAQKAGFVAHLTKPIRIEELEKSLSDIVQRGLLQP